MAHFFCYACRLLCVLSRLFSFIAFWLVLFSCAKKNHLNGIIFVPIQSIFHFRFPIFPNLYYMRLNACLLTKNSQLLKWRLFGHAELINILQHFVPKWAHKYFDTIFSCLPFFYSIVLQSCESTVHCPQWANTTGTWKTKTRDCRRPKIDHELKKRLNFSHVHRVNGRNYKHKGNCIISQQP